MVQVSLISSADNVSDARLHRLCGALVRSGVSVEIFALGVAESAPTGTKFHNAGGGKSFINRIIRDLSLPFRTHGKVVIVVAPDLLVATTVIAKLRRQKIVADVHEDYVQLLRDRSWAKGFVGRCAKVVAQLATECASSADLTTVADVHVPPFSAKKRLVVRNFPDLSLITPSGELGSTPRAIYIGDVRQSRGLHSMLAVAEIATHWEFDIVGSIAPADQEFVTHWQATSDAQNRVHFHGKLPPRQSWKFAEGAWVGLSLLSDTPAFQAAIPSKLYEYMAAGLACLSTPLPRCQELLQKSGAGAVVAKDPLQIAEVLRGWEKDPTELEKIRLQARSWAATNLDGAAEYAAFSTAISELL